jgi:preprotein translocase subunit SecD
VALALVALGVMSGCDAEPSPTVAPTPRTATMVFEVRIGDRATVRQAEAILEARLSTFGATVVASTADGPLRLTLAVPLSVERSTVEAALRPRGLVEWVPWPADIDPPAPGERVPQGTDPLFDSAAGIVSASAGSTNDGTPTVDMMLSADAADALSDYSSAHVGEVLVMALDGVVLTAPTIAGPINGGELRVTLPQDSDLDAGALAAILESGPLPPGWGGP